MVDTTPSIWAPLEDEDSSSIEPLVDIWSWLSYKLSTWNADKDNKAQPYFLMWLLLPLTVFLAWRIYFKERIEKHRADKANTHVNFHNPGSDSGFYKLITQLEKLKLSRKPGETLSVWISRIEKNSPYKNLRPVLALHYRYRFDPTGLEPF